LPKFGKPLNNLTVSVGREAIFTCIVEDLGPYKVSNLARPYTGCLTPSNATLTTNILSREQTLEIITVCCKGIVYFLAVTFGKLRIYQRYGSTEYSTIP
ncbi:hypothetical protein EAG_01209, partial [Camponotus floridanus]